MQIVLPKQSFQVDHGGYFWQFTKPASWKAGQQYNIRTDQLLVMPDDVADTHKQMLTFPVVPPGKAGWPPAWKIKDAEKSEKDHIRLLIMHGVGSGYGDITSGSYAIDRLRRHFKSLGKTLHITALVRELAMDGYYEVYRLRSSLDEIFPFCMTLHEVQSYDYLLSTEHILAEPEFKKLNFYDYWVHKFGLEPDKEDHKFWITPCPKIMETTKKYLEGLRTPGDPFCVVNLYASKLRQIPQHVWLPLTEALASKYRLVFVANPNDAPDMRRWLAGLPEPLKARCYDATQMTALGWDYLTAVISYMADLVVTPDTGVLHLAGILGKPTVAIMFTIEPDLRIRYFKSVLPYVAPEWRESKFWGEHKLTGNQNDIITEMRDRALMDDDYRAAWDAFKVDQVLELCDEALKRGQSEAWVVKTPYVKNAHPRVVIFAPDAYVNYFGDRLAFMLAPYLLPGDAEINWVQWHPYTFVPLCQYDLAIFGLGSLVDENTLVQPLLPEMVRAAKHSIGCFGLKWPKRIDPNHLSGFVHGLDHWYARTQADLDRMQGAKDLGPYSASVAGAVEMALFQMTHWDNDDGISIDSDCCQPHMIDHAIHDIPRNRRVASHYLHPLLCALCGSEQVKYADAFNKEREPSGVFAAALTDIFGEPFRPDAWIDVKREAVLRYKAKVVENVQGIRAKIKEMLA